MKIGISGAHRTGKTTLCRLLANDKMKFIITELSILYKEYLKKGKFDFEETMTLQWNILLKCKKLWELESFITDRTPIDFIAYTEQWIERNNVLKKELNLYEKYKEECYEILNMFDRIFVVQPGIPIYYEEGKADISIDNINDISNRILRISKEFKNKVIIIEKNIIDLDKRIDVINSHL